MAKGKDYDCCYEEMTQGKVWEQSEVPTYDPPYRNKFEEAKNSDFNQSGFGKGKGK